MKKKTILRKRRLTPIQATVLRNLITMKISKVPRSSLELLEKKGLVKGNRRDGWVLTPWGDEWLKSEAPAKRNGRIW